MVDGVDAEAEAEAVFVTVMVVMMLDLCSGATRSGCDEEGEEEYGVAAEVAVACLRADQVPLMVKMTLKSDSYECEISRSRGGDVSRLKMR